METFNQLLNRYVQRAGISDTELARALGVSRQTIFRWREGQTGRPRNRDDILVIARKLRLDPAERDELLLAAGFRPETLEIATLEPSEAPAVLQPDQAAPVETAEVSEVSAVSKSAAVSAGRFPKLNWLITGLVSLVLLAGGIFWWAGGGMTEARLTPGSVRGSTPAGVGGTRPTPASDAERLILVTHFANYASSQIGYNIAGRLTEALQQEIEHSRISQVRVAIWPEVVGDHPAALEAGQAVSATLVIYGEYDAGRIVVKFAAPSDPAALPYQTLQREVLDLQALSTIINGDIPQQVRSLSLLVLGQIYLAQGDPEQALAVLLQAQDKLQDQQVDPQTQAVANFYLGMAYQRRQPPDLEEAIAAYTSAIRAWPELLSSYVNRSAAYADRGQAGDLERALADTEVVVEAKPAWGLAYYNRASIRLRLEGAENTRLALADLDQALELEPELPQAYLNRAYIYLKQGRPLAEVVPALEKALELRPDYGDALNLLCWRYGLEQQPDQAIAYCEQALQLEPERAEFRDSRGLVYALQGNYPAAITDFEAYIAWLSQLPESAFRQQELARRQAWVEALKAGQNPFSPELLRELRNEPEVKTEN